MIGRSLAIESSKSGSSSRVALWGTKTCAMLIAAALVENDTYNGNDISIVVTILKLI